MEWLKQPLPYPKSKKPVPVAELFLKILVVRNKIGPLGILNQGTSAVRCIADQDKLTNFGLSISIPDLRLS